MISSTSKMLESTPRSTLYHVYNRRYERSCKKVFDLDFQGHAIKKEFFHYHRWIPWPQKHTHEKYFWKIRTGRPKSRGVVPPPLGVRRWIFTLGICGLTDCYIFAQLFRSFEVDNKQLTTKVIRFMWRSNNIDCILFRFLDPEYYSLDTQITSVSLK